MTTHRTIDLGLHLLASRGYGAFRVQSQHHRLCNYDPSFDGAVRTWLIKMPDERRDTLIHTLATHHDDPLFLAADKLLAILGALLPDHAATVAAVAAQPVWTTAYTDHLAALTIHHASAALTALRHTGSDLTAPADLIDVAAQARAILDSHLIPVPGADPVTEPAARALRAVVTRLLTESDEYAVANALLRAAQGADW